MRLFKDLLRTAAVPLPGLLLLALLLTGAAASAQEDAAPWRTPEPLTEQDREDLLRAEDYLNQIGTVHGRFVQITSTGHFSEGDIYLRRPGELRFEYDAPVPLLLISDGHTMVMYDKSIESASQIPLSQSPLWFLTRDPIDFTDTVEILAVERGQGALLVSMLGRSALGRAQVDLLFSDSPLELRRWSVVDEQGYIIQVSLVDTQFDVALEDSLFQYRDLPNVGLEERSGGDN
ncbi:LolA family protein [Algihabitans albus]|uniref:LolA family protein n=1 Tax=Algihabitans albus TaxID=2164067 RepID=UPI0013C358FD|nr:outer membrane lipoprotein carrier protein LolA [Algihabitans albus]